MSCTKLWQQLDTLPSDHTTWTKQDQISCAINIISDLMQDGTFHHSSTEYLIAQKTLKILNADSKVLCNRQKKKDKRKSLLLMH